MHTEPPAASGLDVLVATGLHITDVVKVWYTDGCNLAALQAARGISGWQSSSDVTAVSLLDMCSKQPQARSRHMIDITMKFSYSHTRENQT